MLPKWHAYFGIIFAMFAVVLFNVSVLNSSLIFLSSFLIDFDHYMWYIFRKKDFSLKNAYNTLKNIHHEIKGKKLMMIFHTVEFHIFTALLIFFWAGFLYILIGMIFHSIIDIFTINTKEREFSLIKYLISDKTNYL